MIGKERRLVCGLLSTILAGGVGFAEGERAVSSPGTHRGVAKKGLLRKLGKGVVNLASSVFTAYGLHLIYKTVQGINDGTIRLFFASPSDIAKAFKKDVLGKDGGFFDRVCALDNNIKSIFGLDRVGFGRGLRDYAGSPGTADISTSENAAMKEILDGGNYTDRNPMLCDVVSKFIAKKRAFENVEALQQLGVKNIVFTDGNLIWGTNQNYGNKRISSVEIYRSAFPNLLLKAIEWKIDETVANKGAYGKFCASYYKMFWAAVISNLPDSCFDNIFEWMGKRVLSPSYTANIYDDQAKFSFEYNDGEFVPTKLKGVMGYMAEYFGKFKRFVRGKFKFGKADKEIIVENELFD